MTELNEAEVAKAAPPGRSASRTLARRLEWGLGLAVAAILGVGLAGGGGASALRPRDPGTVLLQLTPREQARSREIAALRRASDTSSPEALAAALRLARAQIEAAREQGDARMLGQAEAVLAPWVARTQAPAQALVLQATVLQGRHEFTGALALLARALKTEPRDAQAWLTQASVQLVRGQFEAARESCARLERLVSRVVLAGCLAPIDLTTGRFDEAASRLEAALRESRAPREQAWLRSLAGELAYWRGDRALSLSQLAGARALDPSDRYTRALHADALLDADRPAEALALLSEERNDDALLLRRVLAARALGQSDADGLVHTLRARFEASHLRGEALHLREEARLALALDDGERALALALASLRVQEEPWDVQLVLEAALRTGKPRAAAPALSWLERTGFQAPRLLALRAQLVGGAP